MLCCDYRGGWMYVRMNWQKNDDYNSILLKSLGDRLAEA